LHVINMDDHVAQELARATFARQRRWWRRAALILAGLTLLAALLALILSGPFWPSEGLAALGLLSAIGLLYYEQRYRSKSTLRAQLRAGLRGQRRLVEILSPLDDSYYLVNNLKLPDRADDIDHLLVGPNGIFALETKNHRGRIYWQDDQWYQAKISRRGRPQPKREMRDPTRQLKRNIDHLRSCINHTDPDLARRTRLWIEGVVIFTHPAVSIDIPPQVQETLPFPAFHARELPAFIQEHKPRRHLSAAEVRHIVSMFANLQPPPRPRENN
jgi:hypothetical protein